MCTFLVGKPLYCTRYRSIYYTTCNCFPAESLEYTCKMDARIPKLLSERVLCAHWKGVVYSLKRCCCHIFDISKPFCHYNSGILCHAEQQVAINPTYSNLFIYFNNSNNINNKWFLPVILENNCEMKCVYPKFTTCYLVTWNKMVKLPCYLILCQCYLDTYNWCHVTLLPEMIFHCYLVTCPKYPMLPCYLKTVNRPQRWGEVCKVDIHPTA